MSNIGEIVKGDKLSIINHILEQLESLSFAEAQTEPDTLIDDYLEQEATRLATKRNILYVAPSTKTSISVEDIDRVISFSHQKPHLSQDAVIIINSIYQTNLEAQNKLLKLVEEPPSYLKIYLLQPEDLSQKQRVIDTIYSRCVVREVTTAKQGGNTGSMSLAVNHEELLKIASDFCADKTSAQRAYRDYTKLYANLKKPGEVAALTEKLLETIAQLLSQKLDGAEVSELARYTELTETINKTKQALQSNANTKLLIDNLFVNAIV